MSNKHFLMIAYVLLSLVKNIFGQLQLTRQQVIITTVEDTANIKLYKKGDIETGIYSSVYVRSGSHYQVPWKVYYDQDKKKLAFESIFDFDTCITYEYSLSGQLRKKTKYLRSFDLLDYVWIYEELYCENGGLIRKGYDNMWLFGKPNLKQHTINYYCNGKKKNEFTDIDGVFEGRYTTWYENGQREFDGTMMHSKEHGRWKHWDKNGKLLTVEYFN